MKLQSALLLSLLMLGGLAGCNKVADSIPIHKKVKPEMTIFTVGNLQQGKFVALGTITFDDNHKGKLEVKGDGPAVEKLRAAWAKIADKDELLVKRTEDDENEKGEMMSKTYGITVARSSDEYPQAVMEVLSGEYGFFGTPVEVAK